MTEQLCWRSFAYGVVVVVVVVVDIQNEAVRQAKGQAKVDYSLHWRVTGVQYWVVAEGQGGCVADLTQNVVVVVVVVVVSVLIAYCGSVVDYGNIGYNLHVVVVCVAVVVDVVVVVVCVFVVVVVIVQLCYHL
ncbi:MAG: hypothetical protein AAFY30_16790 [Cyanobacteria bacterium J06642_12]